MRWKQTVWGSFKYFWILPTFDNHINSIMQPHKRKLFHLSTELDIFPSSMRVSISFWPVWGFYIFWNLWRNISLTKKSSQSEILIFHISNPLSFRPKAITQTLSRLKFKLWVSLNHIKRFFHSGGGFLKLNLLSSKLFVLSSSLLPCSFLESYKYFYELIPSCSSIRSSEF